MEPASQPPRAPPGLRHLALGVAVVLFALWMWALWSRRWMADDGLINARVIDNLLEGHGPVFNRGERVEAVTSAAWVWLGALLALLLGDVDVALVFGGLACTVAAVVLAAWPRREADGSLAVPLGLLAYLPLSVGWDFATSGLENGLSLLWLTGAWRVTQRRPDGVTPLSRDALLWGVGPLVRPEFGLYLLGLVGWRAWHLGAARRWAAMGKAVALSLAPLAFATVARGVFYGVLVPNTALAKDAGVSYWPEGLAYLFDFGWTYHLGLPAVALGLLLASRLRAAPPGARGVTALLLALAAAHVGYLAHVGGDFMHGRMLLAPWWLVALAAGTVRLPTSLAVPRSVRVGAVLLAGWAVVAAAALRFDVSVHAARPLAIVDERAWYVQASGVEHPVRRADHARWATLAQQARTQADECARGECAGPVLLLRSQAAKALRAPGSGEPGGWTVALLAPTIGAHSTLAGTDVHVIDSLGLSEPLVARLPSVNRRAGHRKQVPLSWVYARYGDLSRIADLPPAARVAKEALGCGALAELEAAITEPLSARRAWRNLLAAPRLTALRIPTAPAEAYRQFCGREPPG